MLFALHAWDAGPIEGRRRTISGHVVTFQLLPMRERCDLALELGVLMQKGINFESEGWLTLARRMIALSDAPDELFDEDLTAQIPVAATALEINLQGYFDQGERLSLGQSTHSAVRKAMRRGENDEAARIGPDVHKYWFLWRPVLAEACSYEAMFVDQRFTFTDIHRMHEMLDVKQFNEIVAAEVEQP